MAKAKFKVESGLNFLVSTGEPFFVTTIANGVATGVRPITGQDGTRHEIETFPIEQLETRYEQIKRNMAYAEYAEELRADMEEHLMALANESLKSKLPQAKNPSLPFAINRTDA